MSKRTRWSARLLSMLFVLLLLSDVAVPLAQAAASLVGHGPGRVYKVTASSLNLRASASTSARVLEKLPKGEYLTYISTPKSGWYKVRTGDGEVGYVDKRYVSLYRTLTAEVTPKPTATPDPDDGALDTTGLPTGKVYRVKVASAKLYNTYKSSRTTKAVLTRNALVTYRSTPASGWYRVVTNKNVSGYIKSNQLSFYMNLKPTPKPTATPKPTPKPTTTATPEPGSLGPGLIFSVTANSLSVRASTSTAATCIVKIYNGTLVTFVSQVGDDWYRIRLQDGRYGFVLKKHLAYAYMIDPEETPTPPPAPTPTPMDIVSITKQKYSYAEMMEDIRELADRYPGKLEVVSIGETMWGETIPAIRLGASNGSGRSILIDGSIHAREYMSTLLIMRQIEYYLARPKDKYDGQTIEDILRECNIWFVPMVNPDGVYLSQKGVAEITSASQKNRLIQMNNGSTNFTRWKANGEGVDINRNFSAGWYVDPSHKTAGPEGYSGTGALSESESKALATFLVRHPVRAALNYHTRGNYMYWSYGQAGSQRTRDKAIATKISNATGYWMYREAEAGSKSGGFMDYFIERYKLPSFTLELGTSAEDAPQSITQFPEIWSKNRFIPLLLCREAP